MDILTTREFTHFHIACGLGGGAKGFNRSTARVKSVVGRMRCVGGVDSDAAALRDFGKLAKVEGTHLDLFSRAQYVDFHGHEPPAGWREAVPDDFRRAAGYERPNVVVASLPCKGFSGLLSEKMSRSARYQALNALTLRAVWLALEAWKDDPFELFVFENVPRIANRGRPLLDQIQALFRAYNYAIAETTHDCGELGSLAQSRKRFLMVARYVPKVPNFLYEPPKRPLRGVGEILDRLPLPLSGIGGPMHRMPSLQWKTWVRLAFVQAGNDWRSLNRFAVENGVLRDFGIALESDYHRGTYGVQDWAEPSTTVTSTGRPANGKFSVADPRPENFPSDRASYGVGAYDQPAATVTSQRAPGQGRFSVADPRIDGHEKSVQFGVRPWDRPTGVVTGKMFVGGGPNSVADPRLSGTPRNHVFRIVRWGDHSPAVAGPGGPAGGLAVADPRAGDRRTQFGVNAWDEPTGVVRGESHPSNGPYAVADPRTHAGPGTHQNKFAVQAWDGHSKTVTGSDRVGSGALSVADPRAPGANLGKGKYRVTGYDESAGTVIGASTTGQGAFSVADPRCEGYSPDAHRNKLKVVDWEKPAGTITAGKHVQSGGMSVADPRPGFTRDGRDVYVTNGHYGVVAYGDPSGAVTGVGQHDNGRWSVADPRDAGGAPLIQLPEPNDRLVCVIRALDGTWHRPFTTLELAAIQSLVDPDEVVLGPEEYWDLDGMSDSAKRERLGNAIPPDSAEAIGNVCCRTLLLASMGETFSLSSESIWVRNVAVALSVAPGPNFDAWEEGP